MVDNKNIKEIRDLIRNFKVSQADYFSECMIIAQAGDNLYYKGGVFTCDKDSVVSYTGVPAFWVRSFYAFIENVRLGDLFHKAIPLVHWEAISSDMFVTQYGDLLQKYTIENITGEIWAENEASKNLDVENVSNAINILNDSIISSVAVSNEGYVSYFIINDYMGMRNIWPKKTE